MQTAKTMIFATALSFIATAAWADHPEGPAMGPGGPGAPDPQMILDRFDANDDGVLDAGEIEAMLVKQQERRQRMMQRFDHNGDGQLDTSERAAMRQHRMKKHARMLQKYDANGDGKLNPEEREQMRADRQQRRAENLQKYDSNQNGRLDREERRTMRRDRRGQHFDKMVAEHDQNRDGFLSWDEMAAKAAGNPDKENRLRRRFERTDANGDGYVSREEFQNASRRHGRVK